MDVDAFIRECHEQWPSFGNARALASTAHPRDRRLKNLPHMIDGYATENKLMLLNLAANHLAAGEVYVEIGCWKGLTLAGAAHENSGVRIFACDDFSRMGASRELLRNALEYHTTDQQVHFYDQDFRDFLKRAPWQPARVGAYFYDGGHSFHFQFQALELIRPYLADDALVVIDDTNDLPVRRANCLFLQHNPHFQLICDVKVQEYQDQAWWNGLQLIQYRSDPEIAPEEVRRARYFAERVLWNRGVFYAQRGIRLATNGHRAVRRTMRRMLTRDDLIHAE